MAMYDELARGLETSQRRKVDLQAHIEALQADLRATEADIAAKTAAAERMRVALGQHRTAHGSVLGELESRIRQIDRQMSIAARPHLRTASRS